ncbi:MAG: glycosyltransferase family 2 protein [Candidatus Thiothrix putei]|uniref:Rhamnosyltransferase n=2 Tax=Thiothrix TaxID=1030 RepID=A0A1H3VHR9_9GAMM|nr:glycosyltransferase family 2 protein [Thiothrix caldifontis]WGZ93886.1 MAG: glycosyltransferase family 2 protein [Candidatus Thiothrix putei]SDZ74309.1 rhamnosyltransferase [Thiothrix caldifontis]
MTTIISRPDVAVIVLTRNAGRLWPEWIKAIQHQTVQAGRYLVIDSMSDDHTADLAVAAGLAVQCIHPRDFSHGGTRQLAAELCPDAAFLVYLTQDAVLKQVDSLEKLLRHCDDEQVGMTYGRHLPRANADALECHAREFTYPAIVSVRDRESFKTLGYRAAFASDVYAVYRASALRSIGGFPQHIIVSEDSYVAARLLLAGWKTVYAADSTVEHSHHYSLIQIFRRYFDVGVFHAAEQPLMQAVGLPDREAWVYVRSLITYLSKRRKWLLPLAALQTLVKLIGFRLGKRYDKLPRVVCKMISVQRAYWVDDVGGKGVCNTPLPIPTGRGVLHTPSLGALAHQRYEKCAKSLLQNVDKEKLEY